MRCLAPRTQSSSRSRDFIYSVAWLQVLTSSIVAKFNLYDNPCTKRDVSATRMCLIIKITIWIFKDSSFPPSPFPSSSPFPLLPPLPHKHTYTATTAFKVSAHDLGWPLKPRHYEILKSQHRSRYFHLHVHLLVHCWYEVETILSSANVQSVERCSEKTWGEFTLQSLSLSLPHFSTNSTCKKIAFVNSNQ